MDKLKKLIKLMKNRMFANYNNIFPLLWDRTTPFSKFVEDNYEKY